MSETASDGKDAKSALREKMIERTDLRPIIHAMLSGHYEPIVPRELLDQKLIRKIPNPQGGHDIDYDDAKVVWDQLKPERNALIAIFGEEAWQQSRHRRETRDHSYSVRESRDDSAEFAKWTEAILADDLTKWQEARDVRLQRPQEAWDVRDYLYERYRAIIHFGTANTMTDDSASTFISRGVATASSVTWRLAKMLPRLAQKEGVALSKAHALACLRRAYGTVVAQFMSMHKNIAVPLIDALKSDDGFRLDFFALKEGEGGYRLTVDHEKLFQLTDKEGKSFLLRTPDSETTWCPARYSSGEGPALLQEYFDWIIGIAAEHYAPIASLPEALTEG